MGIQRPDSTIISGQIKNNVSYRICGRFVDKEPSRIMLGNDMASTLKNIKGRFIIKDDNFVEIQAFYFNGVSHSYSRRIKNESEETSLEITPDDTPHVVDSNPSIEIKEPIVSIASPIDFDFSDIKPKDDSTT